MKRLTLILGIFSFFILSSALFSSPIKAAPTCGGQRLIATDVNGNHGYTRIEYIIEGCKRLIIDANSKNTPEEKDFWDVNAPKDSLVKLQDDGNKTIIIVTKGLTSPITNPHNSAHEPVWAVSWSNEDLDNCIKNTPSNSICSIAKATPLVYLNHLNVQIIASVDNYYQIFGDMDVSYEAGALKYLWVIDAANYIYRIDLSNDNIRNIIKAINNDDPTPSPLQLDDINTPGKMSSNDVKRVAINPAFDGEKIVKDSSWLFVLNGVKVLNGKLFANVTDTSSSSASGPCHFNGAGCNAKIFSYDFNDSGVTKTGVFDTQISRSDPEYLDGMDVNGDNLYIALAYSGKVLKYNPTTGSTCYVKIMVGGADIAGLDGLKVVSSGYVYVAAKKSGLLVFKETDLANPNCGHALNATVVMGTNLPIPGSGDPKDVDWDDIVGGDLTPKPPTSYIQTLNGNTYSLGDYDLNVFSSQYATQYAFVNRSTESTKHIGPGGETSYAWNFKPYGLDSSIISNYGDISKRVCLAPDSCPDYPNFKNASVYKGNSIKMEDINNANVGGIIFVPLSASSESNPFKIEATTIKNLLYKPVTFIVEGYVEIRNNSNSCTGIFPNSGVASHQYMNAGILADGQISVVDKCSNGDGYPVPLTINGFLLSNNGNKGMSFSSVWWSDITNQIPSYTLNYDPSIINMLSPYFKDGSTFLREIGL